MLFYRIVWWTVARARGLLFRVRVRGHGAAARGRAATCSRRRTGR